MQGMVLVFLGSGLGGVARYAVGLAAGAAFGVGFPWGTLIVNIAGSLVMGLLTGYLAWRGSGTDALRLLLATGFLGGFTTFSAFSLDVALLWERGDVVAAVLYAGLSVLVSLAALFIGLWLTRTVLA
jgi:CrcB protein